MLALGCRSISSSRPFSQQQQALCCRHDPRSAIAVILPGVWYEELLAVPAACTSSCSAVQVHGGPYGAPMPAALGCLGPETAADSLQISAGSTC